MSAFEQREKEREASLVAKFKACDELNNRLALREKSLHELQQELAAKMQRCVSVLSIRVNKPRLRFLPVCKGIRITGKVLHTRVRKVC
jgi:hypothetical protein